MSEVLRYRRFEARDIEAGTALVVQSGWNQTADDWRIFLDLGGAIAVENAAGNVIATAATLPHGPRLGWISMVLVDASYRRRGIATELLRRCIEQLQRDGRVPVLDATPAGRTVYSHLGFRDSWTITRWQVQLPTRRVDQYLPSAVQVQPIAPEHWPAIAALDRRAFGTDRIALLQRLHARSRTFACAASDGGALRGFALGRDGNRATYIGPVVADADSAAHALLNAVLGTLDGSVFLDAVDAHESLRAVLQANGFRVQRPYTRMVLGDPGEIAQPASMWTIAGPELG